MALKLKRDDPLLQFILRKFPFLANRTAKRLAVCLISMLVLCSGEPDIQCQLSPNRERVTIADGIEMTEVANPAYADDWYAKASNVVVFSPDHAKFAFVTRRGDLRTNT